MNEVNIVKLMNGEEIIGKTTFMEQEKILLVEEPLQIIQSPTEDGKIGLAIFPYMNYAKTFIVYLSSVVVVGVPQEELLEKYNRFFSKLIVPTSSLVV